VNSLLQGLTDLAKPYLEDQVRDAARFVVLAITIRGVPALDDVDELALLALKYVLEHGTATPETVAAYLAEHAARPE
jgi:hypothetical protein